jgi:hypothetical protein
MEYRGWKLSLVIFFGFCCTGSVLLAVSSGPPAGRTGDFGQTNCTECHIGNALNAPGGTFAITGVPAEYQAGQTYPITVSIQKPGQSRWGFELAVRSAASGSQAGSLANTGGSTQIIPEGGIQYVMHTLTGTRPGTTSGSWTFNWTAPATAQGPIRFSAAGNAANNSGSELGDFIYTATVTSNVPSLPTTATFAHMAVGGGFSTVFTFMNLGSTPVSGNLVLTGQDGAPLIAALTDPSTGANAPSAGAIPASSWSLSIPPGGLQTVTADAANSSDPTKAGWAHVESSGGALSGVASFQLVSSGRLVTVAGVLSGDPVDSATIPVSDDVPSNVYTGYAVANPSATDTIAIRVLMVGNDGTVAATLSSITLGPGQQTARFFIEDPAASRTFRGSAVLIGPAGQKFSVVALIQNQGLYTAIPVTAGRASQIN